MIGIVNRSNTTVFRKIPFFLLLVLAVAPTVLAETSESVGHRFPERKLDEIPDEVQREPEGDPSTVVINFDDEVDVVREDETEDNECDLCQGLTFLKDNEIFPGMTCADANTMTQDQSIFAEQLGLLDNATLNYAGGCRGEGPFNAWFESCCEPKIPIYQCERNVKEFLFGENGSYSEMDTATPPIVSFKPDQALNVSVWLTYQALEAIHEESGTATVVLSLTFMWKDPRLKWDVDDEKCANTINVWTGYDQGDSQIWIPDFDLTNQIEGIQDKPSMKAEVYSDGTVRMTRFGGFEAFCAFRGLGRIPYDTLGCQFMFASFSRFHSSQINYIPLTPEFTWYGVFEAKYNEWQIVPELGEQGIEESGEFYYNFFFKRARQHYVWNIVVPSILLTYLSFTGFMLDTRMGERLGFGMALALVIVAQQIITADLLPVSDQKLWLDTVIRWSFYWVLVGLIESVLIGFIFFLREDQSNPNNAQEEADEEEREPLSKDSKKKDETEKNQTWIGSIGKYLFYSCPLRSIDMLFLILCLTSYTLFLIFMFVSAKHGEFWLQNEPYWFSETSDVPVTGTPYANANPNI